MLAGATWQRWQVHFLHQLARLTKHAQRMVAGMVRTAFAHPDRASASQQLQQVAVSLQRRFPQVAALLYELAYVGFPSEHWRGIHSTNVLEWLNRQLARRYCACWVPSWRSITTSGRPNGGTSARRRWRSSTAHATGLVIATRPAQLRPTE